MENKNKKVIIIDKKFVVKRASENILKSEKFFIDSNKKLNVQNIICINIPELYTVYKYIDGDIIHELADVNKCLENIYKLINQYSDTDMEGYGCIYDLKKTWIEFLESEIKCQSKYIDKSKFYYNHKVMKKLKILENYPTKKKILHGDLGGFNIICKNKKIVGIIDPRTIIGDPIYDFIYFIFSNYNIAKNINIKEIINITKEPKEKIFAMIYILLYDRIAREQKNKTYYKNEFFKIWDLIEKIEKIAI